VGLFTQRRPYTPFLHHPLLSRDFSLALRLCHHFLLSISSRPSLHKHYVHSRPFVVTSTNTPHSLATNPTAPFRTSLPYLSKTRSLTMCRSCTKRSSLLGQVSEIVSLTAYTRARNVCSPTFLSLLPLPTRYTISSAASPTINQWTTLS
jgi:hypothetical protein